MAAIYFHIPFCKTRCIYCDFFSSTMLGKTSQYVNTLCKELEMRKYFLNEETIHSIYFGGGTPSQLSVKQISKILTKTYELFSIADDCEITIEVNPDDVSSDFAQQLRTLPVNRISMGVQTFNDETLRFINRRHTSIEAIKAVHTLQHAGYNNISIDLMFGFPGQNISDWESDIAQALQLNVQHISAYSLMYEEGTQLFRMLEKGNIVEIDEELSLKMYQTLILNLTSAGFIHYEISNFSLPGFHSRHNSSYWNNTPYLGIGAGAHSYDGTKRQWNISDISQYINGINKNTPALETETLTTQQKYNETVMTRLRTSQGLDTLMIKHEFGSEYYNHLITSATPYYNNKMIKITNDIMTLTREGIYTSNDIISSLFIE